MELFRVTLSYKNYLAEPDKDTGLFPRNTVNTYVAVYGAFGSEMVHNAADHAIEGVVGMDIDFNHWEPIVEKVEQIGSVFIERDAE